MAKALRCYLCSDLHAANRAYRKLLNAIKMNIYQAQVVLIAGDLTGKAIVPLVAQKHGRYQASFLGQSYTLETEGDVQALERAIADVGYYPYRSSQEEIAMLQADPDLMHALFRRKMIERVDEWVELAEERIGQSGVQFYMMPGNDDDLGIDEHIASSRSSSSV